MIQFNTCFPEERKTIDVPTQKTLLKIQDNKCILCDIYLTDIKDHKNYHIDHIIPLSSLSKYNFYGSNNIENLQLLCNPCHKWKTREFEKNMLVSILQNHDSLEISKDFLLDKELENYIKDLSKKINDHLCDIDNNKITNTDIEIYIKKYNDFCMNKFNILNSNNIMRCIYSDEYISYIDKIIYSFIDNLAFFEAQYENKLYNKKEYIYMKDKYGDFYMIPYVTNKQKKDKLSIKKNNECSITLSNKNTINLSKHLLVNTNINRNDNESSSLCSKENTKKRKINNLDYDCNNEIFEKKRKLNIT